MVSQRYSQNSQKVTPKKSAFDLRRSWWCNRLRRRWNTQWQHLSDDGNGTVFPQTLEILSPRKRTWLAGKFSTIWRCISVFKMVMFHCHVSFRGCIVDEIFVAIPVPFRQEGSLHSGHVNVCCMDGLHCTDLWLHDGSIDFMRKPVGIWGPEDPNPFDHIIKKKSRYHWQICVCLMKWYEVQIFTFSAYYSRTIDR